MKTKLFFSACLAAASFFGAMKAQVTIFYDSFEDYEDWIYENIGSWTLRDLDGEAQMGITGVTFPNNIAHPFAGKIVNSTTAIPNVSEVNIPDVRNYEARTGEKVMGMFAALLPPNNDWIISPKIKLGTDGNKLSFFMKSAYMNNNKYEKFRVLISTADTQPESFTAFPQVYEGDYFTNPEWTEFTIDLDEYSNQDVYIAINYMSAIYDNPQYPPHLQKRAMTLLMDDFKITANSVLAANDISNNSVSIYPNPSSDFVNIRYDKEISRVSLYDLSGKKISTKILNSKSGKINISTLKAGIYLLKIEAAGKIITEKIVKK